MVANYSTFNILYIDKEMTVDSIKRSVLCIIVVTILSILLLSICKLDCVTDMDDAKNKKINWGKAISLSITIGIVAGIIFFIMNENELTKSTIETSLNYDEPVSEHVQKQNLSTGGVSMEIPNVPDKNIKSSISY